MTLEPHQERVLKKLDHTDKLLVYHGMGSGKTLTAIAAGKKYNEPISVIGPASLRGNFEKEVKNHKIKKVGLDYSTYHRPNPLANPTRGILVYDEAHNMGQLISQRSHYPDRFVGKKTLFLTGTPIRNNPSELIPLMRGLDIPVARDEKKFRERYIHEEKVHPGFMASNFRGIKPGTRYSLKNTEELSKAFAGKVDYHKPEPKHFPTTETREFNVTMSDRQYETYKAMQKNHPSIAYKVKWGLPPDKAEQKHLNSFLSATRQVSNTPDQFSTVKSSPKDTPKLNLISDHINTLAKKDKNYRGITYSNYIDSGVVPISKKTKVPHAIYSGQLNSAQKNKIVQDYNTGKIKHIFVTSAGSEGLDLKGTKLVQVVEPHWNNPKIDQVIGRAVRYKSHEHLTPKDRKVIIKRYYSTLPDSAKVWGERPLSADEYLHSMAKDKQTINDQFLKVLQNA